MSDRVTKTDATPQGQDPLRTFETALSQLLQGAKRRSPAQTPIALRRSRAPESDSQARERALNDAARALARLWNVSPVLIR